MNILRSKFCTEISAKSNSLTGDWIAALTAYN